MLDIQLLRTDLASVEKRLSSRGFALDTGTFNKLEARRKSVQTETQELQAKRNQLSKQIGQMKGKGEDASALMAQVNAQAERLKTLEQELSGIQGGLDEFLQTIPNLPHASVPVAKSAEDNPELRTIGTPRAFEFPPKDHVDVGTALGLDFEAANKISGARFTVIRGALAQMHRALTQFMLDTHTRSHGYTEVYVPYLVTGECADGVSGMAKFRGDLVKIDGR